MAGGVAWESFCSRLSVGERELFQITSETSCRGSCQLPLQNCSKLTTVSAAVWDEASALPRSWAWASVWAWE